MTRKTRKRLMLVGVGLVVLAALVYGFLPDPIAVDVATVQYGPLDVFVEEEGETQVADTYVIAAPVMAYARRIAVEPGDAVAQDEPLVYLDPPQAILLDPRSSTQARARVRAAEATLTQAEQNQHAATAAAEQATEEYERIKRLFDGGSATQQALTQAQSAARQAEATLEAAEAAVVAAQADVTSARASLQQGSSSSMTPEILTAPITGRVLAVHTPSGGPVAVGQPLLEVGDVNDLEVHVDVLSQDAVQIQPGTPVRLDQWGGTTTLEAVVSRVEAQGFTDVSSLGVEEKRVTVVASLTSPPNERLGLGAGYRVLARFIVWQSDRVLLVPTSALFRTDDGWAVFAIEEDVAVHKPVTIGHQTSLAAEVLSGVSEGDEVIIHPENDLEQGASVVPRDA